MNLMKYRNTFIGIFMTTMLLSVIFLFVNPYNGWGSKKGSNLNLGVDFTGGTKIYFPISSNYIKEHGEVKANDVVAVLKQIKLPGFKFNSPQPSSYVDSKGNTQYQVLVYTRYLNPTEQIKVVKSLEDKFGKPEQGIQAMGVAPVVGKELLENALKAVGWASLLMLAYIWFRFELMSGVAAVIALLHDCLLVVGVFALFGIEFNATIVAALLTILGYSINDTIVVFDRIRENNKLKKRETSFIELVNDSILQTFRRSLNTSFTTVLAILAMYLLVPNIREFCFALIVGITSGTFSSIFIASPIWAVYRDWQEKRKIEGKLAPAR